MENTVILIIDDDPGLRKTLADILGFKGFAVLVAGTGAEGLALLRHSPVDLLLIDLVLPDMSGLEVLSRVKADCPGSEAIILTGHATLDSAVEATHQGAFSYLIKPYEIEQLTLQIRRAVEKQHSQRELRMALRAQEQRTAELAEANRALEAEIAATKRYQQQLEYQANHDGLTGLPNRSLLTDRLDQALSYADRYHRRAAVLFIGLDHFKIINDSLGYETGDRLLNTMAERLADCVRSIDTLARHGADEFVVVTVDLDGSADAARIAWKIQEAVCRPCIIDEHELVITCSTGISLYPKDGEDTQTLLNNAHVAMYRAKDQGRNNFQFYTCELNARTFARMTMEKHLRRALEREELFLHYQPQVDLGTGRIIGMESLLRWQSPELGLIPPARFIPLAEETGLIVPIGEWVLKTSCAQARAWQNAGLPPLVLSVNLSPRQFRQPGLTGMVARILEETGLDPRYLELEIIESMVMHDVDSALAMLNDFRSMGVMLAMDDFGTGYSSLSYLKRFPFGKIKIDQSFVRDITSDPDSAAIARAIIAMGHSLNLRVIAEGIETEGQLRYLHSHGCDEMQGFYFSRPVPPGEFEEMLRENRQLDLPVDEWALVDRTLLLVDDEPHVLSALRRVLTDEGYHILTATSAAEGFELLASSRVGVVVSDMYMPGMNGTEFLSRVKELYSGTIRIMLSGSADLRALTEAINRGAIYKFFIKPWDDERLRENLKLAFRHYRLAHGSTG